MKIPELFKNVSFLTANRRKASQRAVGLVLAASAVVALAGCTAGSAPATTTGKVTLSLLTFETPNLTAKIWDDEIAATNKVVPGVTIKKLVAPNADRNAYATQLDSTGQLPDIMVAVTPTAFAQEGKLAAFTKAELANWISPTSNSFDGKIYQLPTNTQTVPMIYYRKADFTKAGITAVPKTWTELLADAAKLKAAGITPFNIGGGGADTWADLYSLKALVSTEVYAKNPTWMHDLVTGKTNFQDPLFVAAVTKFKQLIDNQYVDPALLSNDYAATQASYLAGTGAMYPMGSWFTTAPDATQQPGYGVFPWPTDSGKVVVPAFTGGGLSVSAGAPNVGLAKKWALAFSQLKQNEDSGVHNDGLFIAIKGYTAPADVPALYAQTLAIYNDALKTGTVTNSFGEEGGTDSLLPGFSDKVAAAVSDLINSRKSVSEFTTFLDDQWKALSK
jgi:ABC-type glycerol-3-phosphate transport system substrate-binding protein